MDIAGAKVAADVFFAGTRTLCRDYLCQGEPDLRVSITREDLLLERNKAMAEDAAEGKPIRNLSDAQLEATALQRKIAEALFAWDTLVFHGSVVAVDGVAYLFTAKSGTGKSTHTGLWRRVFGERAIMVNDDKPFLRITEGGVLAWGSPWCGKHGLGMPICVPLKAICILERGTENVIRKIPAKDALFMLLQQSNRPLDQGKMPVYMELLDRLSRGVAFYRMACNMEPEAALVSHAAMSGEKSEEKGRRI